MSIDTKKLKEIIIDVALKHYGESVFSRRALMNATERMLRNNGFWTIEDDDISESTATKSKGLAKIDWGISSLKKEGRLLNPQYDHWKLP